MIWSLWKQTSLKCVEWSRPIKLFDSSSKKLHCDQIICCQRRKFPGAWGSQWQWAREFDHCGILEMSETGTLLRGEDPLIYSLFSLSFFFFFWELAWSSSGIKYESECNLTFRFVTMENSPLISCYLQAAVHAGTLLSKKREKKSFNQSQPFTGMMSQLVRSFQLITPASLNRKSILVKCSFVTNSSHF